MTHPDAIRITDLPASPARPADAHKGTFGSAMIVGGSEGMAGAASLCGQATLHGGAGLVTVAVPQSVAAIVAGAHPSYMTLQLADEAGKVSVEALPALEVAVNRQTAVGVGPGLGQSTGVTHVVAHLVKNWSVPVVVDADALNSLAKDPTPLMSRATDASRVLTPHPGEFRRLNGKTTSPQDRIAHAVEYARQYEVVLLLKGHSSIVTDGQRFFVNDTGGPSLATGGTGDVLTGLLVALLAQGMPAFEAAQLAAHVHGLAGDCAAELHGDRFVTSLEVVQNLGRAWQRLDGKSDEKIEPR